MNKKISNETHWFSNFEKIISKFFKRKKDKYRIHIGCNDMKIKPNAILFDMDGVLVDSLDSWWESLNNALKAFNHKEITKEEFIKNYWGHDFYDNIKTMGLKQEVGIFCKNTYGDHVDLVKMYPETKDVLRKLNRYKKGIITNTPKDCTYKILNKFDIEHYFDTVVTTDDVNRGKPDPEIIFMDELHSRGKHPVQSDIHTYILIVIRVRHILYLLNRKRA